MRLGDKKGTLSALHAWLQSSQLTDAESEAIQTLLQTPKAEGSLDTFICHQT